MRCSEIKSLILNSFVIVVQRYIIINYLLNINTRKSLYTTIFSKSFISIFKLQFPPPHPPKLIIRAIYFELSLIPSMIFFFQLSNISLLNYLRIINLYNYFLTMALSKNIYPGRGSNPGSSL